MCKNCFFYIRKIYLIANVGNFFYISDLFMNFETVYKSGEERLQNEVIKLKRLRKIRSKFAAENITQKNVRKLEILVNTFLNI